MGRIKRCFGTLFLYVASVYGGFYSLFCGILNLFRVGASAKEENNPCIFT